MKDLIEELRLRHAILNGADPRIKEPFVGPTIFLEAANAIEQLMQERDEARREVCALFVAGDFSVHENVTKDHVAFERGWDCFKEKP